MKNILKNNTAKFISMAFVFVSIISLGVIIHVCSSNFEDNFNASNKLTKECCLSTTKFDTFEKQFAKSLSSEKDVVKLIGFKTYNISNSEKEDFKRLVSEYGEELEKNNHVFSDDFSFFRLYFPLHTAIVEYNGINYTADEKGTVSIPNLTDISKIKVIGRKRSETVHGTGSNIIEKDRILLKEAFRQEIKNGIKAGYSIENNACIFDFKALTSMSGSCCSTTANGIPRLKSGNESGHEGVSCVNNHGGKNCSDAFGIYKGRCTFVSTHCMDYNGWVTDCINGKLINFPGSDCDYAMGSGHCWNEL